VTLSSLKNGCVRHGLPQVLDGNVDQPGAQRALLLVRFFPIVLHDLSPSVCGPLIDRSCLALSGIARE
jgi:hypothetical protein